jgi:hypothetical protein
MARRRWRSLRATATIFLAGEITLLVDDRILAEYRAVLPRPKFALEA